MAARPLIVAIPAPPIDVALRPSSGLDHRFDTQDVAQQAWRDDFGCFSKDIPIVMPSMRARSGGGFKTHFIGKIALLPTGHVDSVMVLNSIFVSWD